MKKTLGILAVSAFLVGGAYLGGKLSAQGPAPVGPARPAAPVAPAAQPPRTKIALVNLSLVIKNYGLYKDFMTGLTNQAKAAQADYEKKNGMITGWKGELMKPETTPAKREQLEKAVKDTQRQMQDLAEEARGKAEKQGFEMAMKTYKDVKNAVEVYARAKDIELVLHFQDAVGDEAYLPQNFQRKLGNTACMPMYVTPGMDITADIIQMLNQKSPVANH